MAIHTHGMTVDAMLATAASIEKEMIKRLTLLATLTAECDELAVDDIKAAEKSASSLRQQVNDWRERAAKLQAKLTKAGGPVSDDGPAA